MTNRLFSHLRSARFLNIFPPRFLFRYGLLKQGHFNGGFPIFPQAMDPDLFDTRHLDSSVFAGGVGGRISWGIITLSNHLSFRSGMKWLKIWRKNWDILKFSSHVNGKLKAVLCCHSKWASLVVHEFPIVLVPIRLASLHVRWSVNFTASQPTFRKATRPFSWGMFGVGTLTSHENWPLGDDCLFLDDDLCFSISRSAWSAFFGGYVFTTPGRREL